MKGQRPEYNFTSQYITRVDDFFLHYLQKKTTTIELHQAIGSDYETRAACQLSFRELIDKETSRIHGSARLICVNSNNVGVSFGTLEYWARLIVPVDQAFRLYRERTKALGYLATNTKAIEAHGDSKLPMQKSKSSDNMNELNINVLRCSKVDAGNKNQPSPYLVYKFYDFSDHDTEIIKSSNNPEFNDHKSFAVQMDIDLDKYLKNEALEVYVFDDNQAENDAEYLGVAKVPLIGLAHDKDIKGTFELKKSNGTSNGTVDITLYWQYSYLPPAASTFSATGSKQPTKSVSLKPSEKRASIASIQEEENSVGNSTLHRKPTFETKQSSAKQSPRSPDHYNDTMFEEEPGRTYSPNELDSLRNVYQNNVASYEEKDDGKIPISEGIEENVGSEEEVDYSEEEENGNVKDNFKNFKNYNATAKSDDGVVVDESWDPNATNKMAKEGDQDNVIIEILSFSLKENSQVLQRDDIQRLFVSMEFLNLDSSELESNITMAKPEPNKPVHFNFRKVFQVDAETNMDKRQVLANMIIDKNQSM